jgi:hypothetical protein
VEKVGLGLHLCLGFDSIILFLVRIDDFNSSLSIKKKIANHDFAIIFK